MSETTAANDAAFLRDVSDSVGAACEAMRTHTLAMIDDYLRSRVAAAEAALQQRHAHDMATLRAQHDEVAAHAATLSRHLARAHTHRHRSAAAHADSQTQRQQQLAALRCWHLWCDGVRRRRAARARAACVQRWLCDRPRAAAAYVQWRLFAAARRQGRLAAQQAAAHAQQRDDEVALLRQQLNDATSALVTQQRLRDEVAAQLQLALARGATALGREAVHTLRSARSSRSHSTKPSSMHAQTRATSNNSNDDDDSNNNDSDKADGDGKTQPSSQRRQKQQCSDSISALACTLADEATSSVAVTPTHNKRAPPTRSNDDDSDKDDNDYRNNDDDDDDDDDDDEVRSLRLCPVHCTDAHGSFYHRCYAPHACACRNKRSGSHTPRTRRGASCHGHDGCSRKRNNDNSNSATAAAAVRNRCNSNNNGRSTRAHVPFVVDANARTARNYDAGPVLLMTTTATAARTPAWREQFATLASRGRWR